MNEPQELCCVALSGLSIAEYFRDGAGTDQGKMYCSSWIISSVLHKQVLKSALLGRMPSVGYQPTLTEMRCKSVSLLQTKVYYICTSGLRTCGWFNRSSSSNNFAHLDATTVLSRKIAELGIYPAVDPLTKNPTLKF
jgi:F-type H+-transporting ATPase subunit beta